LAVCTEENRSLDRRRHDAADQAVESVVVAALGTQFPLNHRAAASLSLYAILEFAESADRYVAFADQAERLGGDAMDEVRHIKSRLVKVLEDKGHAG
jgi:hypothetical protein